MPRTKDKITEKIIKKLLIVFLDLGKNLFLIGGLFLYLFASLFLKVSSILLSLTSTKVLRDLFLNKDFNLAAKYLKNKFVLVVFQETFLDKNLPNLSQFPRLNTVFLRKLYMERIILFTLS